jgi:hypothetical protein
LKYLKKIHLCLVKSKIKPKKEGESNTNNNLDLSILSNNESQNKKEKNSNKSKERAIEQIVKVLNKDTEYLDELKKVLQKINDYKYMFGYVPFKIVYDHYKNHKKIVIPAFGSGNFKKVLDPITFNYKIKFTTNHKYKYQNESDSSKLESIKNFHQIATSMPGLNGKNTNMPATSSLFDQDTNTTSLNEEANSDGFHVFVWQSTQITTYNDYHSVIEPLYKWYYFLKEQRKNISFGTKKLSNPIMFTKMVKEFTDIQGMTERHVTSESSISHSNQKQMYEIDTLRQNRLEQAIDRQNDMLKSLSNNSNSFIEEYDEDTGKVKKTKVLNSFESGHTIPLPTGEDIAAPPQAKIISASEYLQYQEYFDNLVCQRVGFPKSYLTRDRTVKSDALQEEKIILQRVHDIRENMQQFYSYASKFMYEDKNRIIHKTLLESATDIHEQKKKLINAYLQSVTEISDWKNIFELLELPFDEGKIIMIRKKITDLLTPNNSNNNIQEELLQDSINKTLKENISNFILDYIKEQYELQIEEINVMYSSKNLVRLVFKEQAMTTKSPVDVDAIARQGFVTEEEEITLNRTFLSLDTSPEVIKKIAASVQENMKRNLKKQKEIIKALESDKNKQNQNKHANKNANSNNSNTNTKKPSATTAKSESSDKKKDTDKDKSETEKRKTSDSSDSNKEKEKESKKQKTESPKSSNK